MGTAERRLEIYKYLCFERKATIPHLAELFNVSTRTIQRDLLEIEETFHAPIETMPGRFGGVFVVGDFRFDYAYMSDEELNLLKKVQLIVKDQISESEDLSLSKIIQKYSRRKNNDDSSCPG